MNITESWKFGAFWLVVLIAALVALAADKNPNKSCQTCVTINTADSKPKWNGCQIGSEHHCHCPRMVARETEKILAECKRQGHEPEACILLVNPCDIISHYDSDHPADMCKVACKKDSCRCHDGPECGRFYYDYHGEDEK